MLRYESTARREDWPLRVRLLAGSASDTYSGSLLIEESKSSSVESVTAIAGPSSAESKLIRPEEPTTYWMTALLGSPSTDVSFRTTWAPLLRIRLPGNIRTEFPEAIR